MLSRIAFCLLTATAVPLAAQDTVATGESVVVGPPSLTSRHRLSRDLLRRLPVDDPRSSLFLIPGVVSRDLGWGVTTGAGISLRGSSAGEASVYVDGAPVRNHTFGFTTLIPGLVGIEELTVTTGVPNSDVSDVRAGVVEYATRSGGTHLAGDFRAESDEFFGDGSIVGYNRLEGWAGGPVPGAAGVRWFLSGAAQGQRSRYRGMGAAEIPAFVPGGVDIVVSESSGESTTLPQYVQWSGECDGLGNGANPVGAAIQDNYGYECQGLRRPMDWSSALRVQAKAVYEYGDSRQGTLSVTGLAVGLQQRDFPGPLIGAPSLYRGSHAWSRLLVANWDHRGFQWGRPVRIRVNASYGSDRSIAGPLTAESEVEMRDPALGIALPSLTFTGGDVFPYPINDQVLRDVRTNSGLRTPYYGRDDLRNAQTGRLNPYGLQNSGWYTQGLETTYALAEERRWQVRGSVAMPLARGHDVTLGLEWGRTHVSRYAAEMISDVNLDAFIVEPGAFGAFLLDRITLGSNTVIDAALRYDRYSGGGPIPVTPGVTFSHPNFTALYPNAATDDAEYAAYLADPDIWREARDQSLWSPRIRVGHRLSDRTALRLGFGRQVEAPSLSATFTGANTDAFLTAGLRPLGRDVEYAQSSLAEVGATHRLSSNLSVDAAAYWKDGLVPYGRRFEQFVNPRDTTDTITLAVLARVDSLSAIGLDLLVDWRAAEALTSALAYTFQTVSPPEGETITTHSIAGYVTASVPAGWGEGSFLGTAARGVSAVALFRFTNGVSYTPRQNTGQGLTLASDPRGGFPIASPNSSHLPWIKHLDLRLVKAWQVRGVDWSLYLDLRNLFNFRNQVDVFTETGDTANSVHRALVQNPEFAGLATEAAANSALAPDGSINVQNCATWSVVLNCVSLQRVENRYGNGDGLYAVTEAQRALDAYYDAFFGSWRFYQPSRTLRIGAEVGF